jgi:membrane peptidoglycan carboxypeptidase
MIRGPAGESAPAGDPTVPLPVGGSRRLPAGAAGSRSQPQYQSPGQPQYQSPAGYRPRPRRFRRILRRTVVLLIALILLALVAFGALLAVTPSVGNARQLAKAQAAAHHAVYPGPPVPARFAASLVATEDHRFYSEPGIDVFAIGRVAASYLTGGGDQGGATLYQQLAKVLYTQGRSGLKIEAEQVALAIKLDMTYTKKQILRMYAGVVYFGNGYYGLAAASCGYFDVRPAGLSWPEAALLAGLVQGPTADDPVTHPATARAREAHVLGRLVATGVLTPAQAAAAQAVPLGTMLAHSGSSCTG